MEILFIIPARGGSKGIPQKNIKLLAGKPLIYYTIDIARQLAKDIDICVSTDSLEIIDTVEKYGLSVPFVRPPELATDTSTTNDLVNHALKFYKSNGKIYDVVILLQPTSPFRTSKQVKSALEILTSDIDMVVSVKESLAAAVICKENAEGFIELPLSTNVTRRQDMGAFYEYNGAIYVINVKSLEKRSINEFERKVKYIMPAINSIDIDTPLDWAICEAMIDKGFVSM